MQHFFFIPIATKITITATLKEKQAKRILCANALAVSFLYHFLAVIATVALSILFLLLV